MLHREPRSGHTSSRLALAAVIGGVSASIAGLVYARYIEPYSLLVRSYDLALPSLPDALDGVEIAFLSDFHIGGPGDNAVATQMAIRAVEQTRPDLILLGGDYYDDGKRRVPEPEWSRFSAIAPTYAVLGNHDYKVGAHATAGIVEKLERSGIPVLRNQSLEIPLRGTCLGLIGVDDAFTGRADYERANQGLHRDAQPRILLTHAGLLADSLPIGAADLLVSGHTHGGQVRISPLRQTTPLDAFWWLDFIMRKRLSPYRQGLFYVRGSLVFVGNGVGTTTLGLRFLAPPDVTFFRLRRGDGDPAHPCDGAERYVQATRTSWVRQPEMV